MCDRAPRLCWRARRTHLLRERYHGYSLNCGFIRPNSKRFADRGIPQLVTGPQARVILERL